MRGPRPLAARLLRLLARGVLLAVLILIALPALVTIGAGAQLAEAAGRALLGAGFSVRRVSMDWSGRLRLAGLRLDRPGGQGPLLEAEALELDLGLARLLAGRLEATLALQGLRVSAGPGERPRVERLLGAAFRLRPRGPAGIARLSLSLASSEFRFLDAEGALEARFLADGCLRQDAPDAPLRIRTTGKAFGPAGKAGGELRCAGLLDRDGAQLELEAEALDLALWLAPIQRSSGLSGTTRGRLLARCSPRMTRLEGELRTFDLALRHPLLGQTPLRQELLVLEGRLAFDPRTGAADLSEFQAACGPLQVRGLRSEPAAALLGQEGSAAGLAATLDLSGLPRHPALLPPGASCSGRIEIEAASAPGLPALENGSWKLALSGRELRWRDQRIDTGPLSLSGQAAWTGREGLAGLEADLALAGREIKAAGRTDLELDAGLEAEAGRVRLEFSLRGAGEAAGGLALELLKPGNPASLQLRLTDFQLDPALAPALAFLVPFAVAPDSAVLEGRLALRAAAAGRLTGAARCTPRETLSDWEGSLDYRLEEMNSPASDALAPLLAAFGAGRSFRFPGLAGSARLARGALAQEQIRIETGGTYILASGSTTLEGGLDYRFDCSPLLEQHAGRRLLAALGSLDLPVALRGTLAAPQVLVRPIELEDALREEPHQRAAER